MEQVLTARHCEKCGHEWMPRKAIARTCPKCQSPYWDIPKDGSGAITVATDGSGEVLVMRVTQGLLERIDKKVSRSKSPSRTQWLLWAVREGLRDRHGRGA